MASRRSDSGSPALREYNNRPGPRELYPFIAYIRIQGKDLGSVITDLRLLLDLFPGHKPAAVGITKAGNYGWICLLNAK